MVPTLSGIGIAICVGGASTGLPVLSGNQPPSPRVGAGGWSHHSRRPRSVLGEPEKCAWPSTPEACPWTGKGQGWAERRWFMWAAFPLSTSRLQPSISPPRPGTRRMAHFCRVRNFRVSDRRRGAWPALHHPCEVAKLVRRPKFGLAASSCQPLFEVRGKARDQEEESSLLHNGSAPWGLLPPSAFVAHQNV